MLMILTVLFYLTMLCLLNNIEQAELAKKNKNVTISYVGEDGKIETHPFCPQPSFKLYWIAVALFFLTFLCIRFAHQLDPFRV